MHAEILKNSFKDVRKIHRIGCELILKTFWHSSKVNTLLSNLEILRVKALHGSFLKTF